MSFTKASTSSGFGGSPIRSRLSRRASVRRSASGAGFRPRFSSSASTKASIGLRTHALSLTSGTAGRVGGISDQCFSYSAPWATHRLSVSFWAAVSVFFVFGGGIRSDSSSEKIRWMAALSSGLPGTIASASIAWSRTSSRSFALRAAESGPWQGKQFSMRIGRTSRL